VVGYLERINYSLGAPPLLLTSGDQVKIVSEQGEWTQIQKDKTSGWIPSWYLSAESGLSSITHQYQVVNQDTELYLNPQGSKIASLKAGKLAQVTHQYQDWSFINIVVYDIPSVQEGWIKTEYLSPKEDHPAKEGLLKKGTTVLYDNGQQESLSYDTPVLIVQSDGNLATVIAAGGWRAQTDPKNVVFSEELFSSH